MSARWATCPRCQVRFQTEAVGIPLCPACVSSDASISYYIVQNKQKIGPLSLAQMQQFSQSGQLKPGDMVLPEGGRTWAPASSIATLFAGDTVDESGRTATFTPAVTGSTVSHLGSSQSTAAKSTPVSATPVPSIPGYEILEELGRGGMGVVYKARQTALKRLVALKMILAGGHASKEDLNRFLAEAQAVARLQHPNIVQVYEIGEKDGLPYFSLEFVEGGTLSKHLAGTPLPPRDAAQLTVTLSLAIEAAHQAGIVHRDLKPANVLLASGDTPLAVPKIADFGLAKTLDDDSGQTRTGAIMGTPSYMSPEQASGQTKAIGTRTDVYALGTMLYDMVTGRSPFRAATVLETLEQVRTQEPVSPRSLQPSLPRDLETICLKCLSKEPAQRYGTAKELADDLQRFLNNQPILARPASLQERALKFVKRNRLLVGLTSAIILALLIGFISSSLQAARANRSAAEARKALAEVYATTAQGLVQRGRHIEGLEYYEKALDAGHSDSLLIRLNMARAYAAIYQPEKTRAILDALLDEPNLGESEGSVLLLKAYTTMGNEVKDATDMIHRALEKGLPPAEKFFARAMLAETSPEAVALCRQALEADPYHHPSHTMLGLLLVLLGRMKEAEKAHAAASVLFPDDPNMKILGSILLAVDGKKAEAIRSLQGIKTQVTARQYRVIEAAVELMGFLQVLDDPENEQERVRLATLWLKLVPDLDSIWPTAGKTVSVKPEEGASQLLKMPPVLNRSLMEMMEAMSGVVMNMGNPESSKKLEQILKKHPEGTLFYLHGSTLALYKRWAEARPPLLSAVRSPGMGRLQRTSMAMLLHCDSMLIDACNNKDDKLRKEAQEHFEEFLRMAPVTRADYLICAKIAIATGELYKAQEYLALAVKERIGDPADVLVGLMVVEKMLDNPNAVIGLADRILKLDPKHSSALKHRADAVARLQALINAAGGR
jgi:serine/threonine protein kinase